MVKAKPKAATTTRRSAGRETKRIADPYDVHRVAGKLLMALGCACSETVLTPDAVIRVLAPIVREMLHAAHRRGDAYAQRRLQAPELGHPDHDELIVDVEVDVRRRPRSRSPQDSPK